MLINIHDSNRNSQQIHIIVVATTTSSTTMTSTETTTKMAQLRITLLPVKPTKSHHILIQVKADKFLVFATNNRILQFILNIVSNSGTFKILPFLLLSLIGYRKMCVLAIYFAALVEVTIASKKSSLSFFDEYENWLSFFYVILSHSADKNNSRTPNTIEVLW